MEKQYTYFLILAFSLAGPLALSFDKKVAFWKKWQFLFPAMLVPGCIYVAWDMYFTSKGVWSFNTGYYMESLKVYNLPLEEILFFVVVPYCCMFIYECIRSYFPTLKEKRKDDWALKGIAVLLFIVGFMYRKQMYTSWTFLFLASYIAIIYVNRTFFKHFDATSFILSYSVVLLPFMVVNGYLTAIPVVLYNNHENLNIRITTIPIEDIFYGMLLMLMTVTIYEKLKARSKSRHKRKRSSNPSAHRNA